MGHRHPIYALEKINENTFLSAGSDQQLIKWSTDNTIKGQVIAKLKSPVFCIKEINELCLCGTQDGKILVIDLIENTLIKYLDLGNASIFDLIINDKEIIVALGDGNILWLDINSFNINKLMKVSTKSIRTLSHNENEKKLFAGSSDNCIYIIDTIKSSVITKLTGHKNSVFCTSIFNKNKIISGSRDAQLASWNMDAQSLDKIVVAHMATINSLSINPSNNLLATASRDKTIKLWEADTLKLLKVIEDQKMPAHQRSVNKILWLDDNYLISASDDTKVILWCIEKN